MSSEAPAGNVPTMPQGWNSHDKVALGRSVNVFNLVTSSLTLIVAISLLLTNFKNLKMHSLFHTISHSKGFLTLLVLVLAVSCALDTLHYAYEDQTGIAILDETRGENKISMISGWVTLVLLIVTIVCTIKCSDAGNFICTSVCARMPKGAIGMMLAIASLITLIFIAKRMEVEESVRYGNLTAPVAEMKLA